MTRYMLGTYILFLSLKRMISTIQVRTYSIIELPIGYKDKELEELVLPMTSTTTHKGKRFFSKSIEQCIDKMNSNKITTEKKLEYKVLLSGLY